jgi:hypothetical protein
MPQDKIDRHQIQDGSRKSSDWEVDTRALDTRDVSPTAIVRGSLTERCAANGITKPVGADDGGRWGWGHGSNKSVEES